MKIFRFCLFIALCHGAGTMILMFLSLYLKNKGIDEAEIGGLLGTYHLMMPIVILFFGILADRISCRQLILAGAIISAVYCAAMPFVESTYLMGIFIAIGGIGHTLSYITVYTLFLKNLGNQSNGKGKSLSIFVSSTAAGYASCTMLCSLLVRQFNFSPEIIFYAGFPLHLISLFVALKLPEAKVEKFPLIEYFHEAKQVPAFCIILVAFAIGVHFGSETFAIVRFMDEVIMAKGYEMALYFLCTGICLSAFSRIGGKLFDYHGKIAMIVIPGLLLSSIFHILTTWAGGFYQLLFIRMIHTCGDGMVLFSIPMLVRMGFHF